jgi:hypothetical protein
MQNPQFVFVDECAAINFSKFEARMLCWLFLLEEQIDLLFFWSWRLEFVSELVLLEDPSVIMNHLPLPKGQFLSNVHAEISDKIPFLLNFWQTYETLHQ